MTHSSLARYLIGKIQLIRRTRRTHCGLKVAAWLPFQNLVTNAQACEPSRKHPEMASSPNVSSLPHATVPKSHTGRSSIQPR